jgi:2-dehydro-3-deoxyphosphogluconate aldolase / (4S)-4-hydroxy-2-oxoglutarate aldolase
MSVPERFQRLAAARLIAVIRAESPDQAVPLVGALLEGGVPAIELTFTIPAADRALAKVRSVYGADVLLGAGTIRIHEHIERAVHAGADFLVSPHLQPSLLQAMLATELPAIPGALTPSEVAQALDLGAEAVKLFPASSVGSDYLRALRGPFPELLAIPTGGIRAADFQTWFTAGALAVGVGGELMPRELVRSARWDEISRIARQHVEAARVAADPTMAEPRA